MADYLPCYHGHELQLQHKERGESVCKYVHLFDFMISDRTSSLAIGLKRDLTTSMPWIYTYRMMINPKVLLIAKTLHVMLVTLEKVVCQFAQVVFLYSFLKAITITSCRRGVWQENGTAHLPFPSWVAGELPKVRLRHSQIPWSWSASLHLPLVLPNRLFEASTNKPQIRRPSLQSEALREPHTKAPGVCFSFVAPPADGSILIILRTGFFPQKFCQRVGESQNAFGREWPGKPCKKSCQTVA